MDTIIYLYHSTAAENYCIEKWKEKEYCLIRLGIPGNLWKNLNAWEEQAEEEGQKGRRSFRRSENGHGNPLLEELAVQQTALALWEDNPYETYCVYEKFLWEKIDTKLWWKYWKLPQLQEYHDMIWAEELMQHGIWDSLLILGNAPCVTKLLYKYAGRLRTVKWILRQEQYTEALQDFLEDFYEEYGLMVACQVLEPGEHWAAVRPKSVLPVTVLDFTGEEKISAYDLVSGSVWLDMDSLDGKEWRMKARNPHITYYSLKKQWACLDTIGKNRYNT